MWKTDDADLAARRVMRVIARLEARSVTPCEVDTGLIEEPDLALGAAADIVTIGEIFATEAMIEFSEQLSRLAPQQVRNVAEAAGRRDAEGSWGTRKDFAKTWMGVEWSDKGWFREWLGYVEARNAWAHRHGVLTRRQQGNQGVSDRLKGAGLVVVDGRLKLGAGDVDRCGRAARLLLSELDEALFRSRTTQA